MAQSEKLSPSSSGSQKIVITIRPDPNSCTPPVNTQNSSYNSTALLGADSTKDRRRHPHRDDPPTELSSTDTGGRPGRGTTRRRHFSEPPSTRSCGANNASLSWAHTAMNTNESLRTTLSASVTDKEMKSAFHQNASTESGDFTDATLHNISGLDKSVCWQDQSPEKKVTISHIDEQEISMQSSETSTAEINTIEHMVGEMQIHGKTNIVKSPKDKSCYYATVDVLEDMQTMSTSESRVFCNEINSIDTFLDIDTGCLDSTSFTSVSSVECTGNGQFNSLTVVTEISSDDETEIPASELCFHERPSKGKRFQSTRKSDVSPKRLQNYGGENISESQIVKDEMIFEPSSRAKSRLYLGCSALDANTYIGNANGDFENEHSRTDEITDGRSGDKTDKTITHSSRSQLSITGKQKAHSKVYSLKCCKSADNKARRDSFSMTESKSNLDPLYASDDSWEGSDSIREEETINTDFLSRSGSKQSPSEEDSRREVDFSSRERRNPESKANRKPTKGKYRKRRMIACKGRSRKVAERRCSKSTKHSCCPKDGILASTVTYTMAPFLQTNRGRIKYERKDGKYICRGVRKTPQAQNINFNSGEIKLNTEAKASGFIGEYLFELWKNQCLCDVKLESQGGSFLAHKIVLAAFSDAFCPCEPVPAPSLSLEMPDTTSDAVYQVLLYLYTSEMELSDDTMEDVLNAAVYLGVSDVVELIKDILTNPTKENFSLYLEIAERLQLPITLMSMPHLIREHLHDVWDSEHYKKLTLENMLTILSDQELMVNAESDILEAVCKWADYHFPERIPDAITLLQRVNFVCIEPGMLSRTVEKYEHIFDHKDLQQLLAHIYKSFAVNSIVRDSSGYYPEGSHCRKQKNTESGVRPRMSDEYRTPVYHAAQNPITPANPLAPLDSPNLHSPPGTEHFAGKTTHEEDNPRWQSHPELLMDSKTTSISLPTTDRAKLATQQTIRTINEQFQRVFGPRASSNLMDFCKQRRTPANAHTKMEENALQLTSHRFNPMADRQNMKMDTSTGIQKFGYETWKLQADNVGHGEMNADKFKTYDQTKFNKGTCSSCPNGQGAKHTHFAPNIPERRSISSNMPGARFRSDSHRNHGADVFPESNHKGATPEITRDDSQLPEFGLKSICPDTPHCSRAIQKRLLYPTMDGVSKKDNGNMSNGTAMPDKTQNHSRFATF